MDLKLPRNLAQLTPNRLVFLTFSTAASELLNMQKLSTQPTPGNTYVSRTDDILGRLYLKSTVAGSIQGQLPDWLRVTDVRNAASPVEQLNQRKLPFQFQALAQSIQLTPGPPFILLLRQLHLVNEVTAACLGMYCSVRSFCSMHVLPVIIVLNWESLDMRRDFQCLGILTCEQVL